MTIKEQQVKRRAIKAGILLGIVILILIFFWQANKKTTFVEGFAKLKKMDNKFDAGFKAERLNTSTMVSIEKIDPLLEEINAFQKKVLAQENTTDAQALVMFTDIRMKMLKSEKFFQQGEQMGNVGKVFDGFRCNEQSYLLNAAYYYNQSWVQGLQAQLLLDSLLYDYRDVPGVREDVGLNDDKTAFFKSPLSNIKHIAVYNVGALAKYCGYDATQQLMLHQLK